LIAQAMKQHDNDDTDTWLSIGLQAALIVNKLRNRAQLTERAIAQDNQPNEQQRSDDHRKEEEARLALVKRRLDDLAALERRARGKD
jgi:hypothetical protein